MLIGKWNYIRIIPVLYFKFGKLVKSFQFKNHHKIGSIITQTNRFKEWDIDEIVLIDITHQTVTDKKHIKGSGTHFRFTSQLKTFLHQSH